MSTKNISDSTKRLLIEDDGRSDERDVRFATAPYQADFPYERGEEAQVTRREFCNFLGLTSAALFLGSSGFAAKAVIDSRAETTFTPLRINGAETLPLNPGSVLAGKNQLEGHNPVEGDLAGTVNHSHASPGNLVDQFVIPKISQDVAGAGSSFGADGLRGFDLGIKRQGEETAGAQAPKRILG